MNLVSIYQRRIIDDKGHIENGIEKMFRNIIKSRKEAKKLKLGSFDVDNQREKGESLSS